MENKGVFPYDEAGGYQIICVNEESRLTRFANKDAQLVKSK